MKALFNLLLRPLVALLLLQLPPVVAQLGAKVEFFGDDAGGGTPGSCAGVADMCDACFKTGGELCKMIDEQCKQDMCLPLCLRLTFDCEVEASGCSGWDGCEAFEKEMATKRVSNALCGQFKAEACATKLGCCDPESPWLDRWVEERMYGGYFPSSTLPTLSCQHDPEDEEEAGKICDACKAAVKVKITPKECKYPNPPSEEEKQPPAEEDPFKNAELTAADEIPKHRSWQDRCETLVKEISGAKGGWESDFKEKACTCLGCCDGDKNGECYFPAS